MVAQNRIAWEEGRREGIVTTIAMVENVLDGEDLPEDDQRIERVRIKLRKALGFDSPAYASALRVAAEIAREFIPTNADTKERSAVARVCVSIAHYIENVAEGKPGSDPR